MKAVIGKKPEWRDLTAAEARRYMCSSTNCDETAVTADLPAACAGAPHNRPRLWYMAHAESGGREGGRRLREAIAQSYRDQPTNRSWWNDEPDVARVADGIPNAVAQRRALGNAIVAKVAAEFIGAADEIISAR